MTLPGYVPRPRMGLRRRQRQSGGIASSNLAFVRASRRASRSNHPGHYRNNRNETLVGNPSSQDQSPSLSTPLVILLPQKRAMNLMSGLAQPFTAKARRRKESPSFWLGSPGRVSLQPQNSAFSGFLWSFA